MFRIKGNMLYFVIIYVGIVTIMISDIFNRDSYNSLNTMFTIFNLLGSALTIGGIVAFIVERRFSQLEKEISNIYLQFNKGAKGINGVPAQRIDEVIKNSSLVSIQINFYGINNNILELISNLRTIQSKTKIQLLIAGLYQQKEKSNIKKYPFARRLLFELEEWQIIDKINKTNIEIRWCENNIFNTVITGKSDMFLLTPYGLEGDDLMWFKIDNQSELADQYRLQFEKLWSHSKTIGAINK